MHIPPAFSSCCCCCLHAPGVLFIDKKEKRMRNGIEALKKLSKVSLQPGWVLYAPQIAIPREVCTRERLLMTRLPYVPRSNTSASGSTLPGQQPTSTPQCAPSRRRSGQGCSPGGLCCPATSAPPHQRSSTCPPARLMTLHRPSSRSFDPWLPLLLLPPLTRDGESVVSSPRYPRGPSRHS